GMDTIINGCSPIAIAWKEADTPTTPSPSPTAEATATPEPTVSAEPTATAAASPASTAPSTGDEESPMLWAALVILCAAGLGAALTLTRKGRE
ncbi:MAG: hypothetical protein LUG57_01830, partial [Oscillospiraceae bacterium]|nr:hypothetical protein [Oscillospiraceae bacterium]